MNLSGKGVRRNARSYAAIGLLIGLAAIAAASSASAEVVYGACRFELSRLAFAGAPLDQARCLLRRPGVGGVLPHDGASLPPALEARIGLGVQLSPQGLASELAAAGVAMDASGPLSRAYDGDPFAPAARYFVIHDTSQPFYRNRPFPVDLEADPEVENIARYMGPDAVAHFFVSRTGRVLVGHDLSVAWRATKLESRVIGLPAKGLFIHVETVEPRRSDERAFSGNDFIAPVPGFSAVQYERLALLYAAASARAGVWLIPAFHADIDEGLPAAHDDPQNVSLEAFAQALAALCLRIEKP